MKGFTGLVVGIFAVLAFSWAGLAFIPSLQIGHEDPQMDEDGNDAYPAPRSGMAERGRRIYVANGCIYCHTQQVRPDYLASDIDRKWGQRRSAPRDYLFDRPVLLGKMRTGPDLSNVGKRAPVEDESAPASNAPAAGSPAPQGNVAAATAPAQSPPPQGAPPPSGAPSPQAGASPQIVSNAAPAAAAPSAPPAAGQQANSAATAASSADTMQGDASPPAYSAVWHHQHLYAPRSVTQDSVMPAYRFLYDKRKIEGERAPDALKLSGKFAPSDGYEVVPTYDANCLVAYLMSLDQSHALKEVKSDTPPTPPAPAKGVK